MGRSARTQDRSLQPSAPLRRSVPADALKRTQLRRPAGPARPAPSATGGDHPLLPTASARARKTPRSLLKKAEPGSELTALGSPPPQLTARAAASPAPQHLCPGSCPRPRRLTRGLAGVDPLILCNMKKYNSYTAGDSVGALIGAAGILISCFILPLPF